MTGRPPESLLADPKKPLQDLKKKALLVLFGLFLSVAFVALLEGGLAVLGVGDDWLHDDPFVGFAPGSSLFEAKTLDAGQEVWATRPQKLTFFNHQEFPQAKAPGTFRIFTVGGSTTAGRPYDDRTAFSNWLRLFLTEADPSQRYEVINAGAISYASYRVALLMKELVRYQPDLFVVYTGHNEFLEERSYSEIIHQPEAVKRLRMWLGGFRVAALARRGFQSVEGNAEPPDVTLQAEVSTRLDSWTGLDRYRRDPVLEESIEEHFAFNLERMVSLAKDAGAQIFFVEPVANLKDFSPFKSEHRADWTREQAIAFDLALEEASQFLESGETGEALDRLDAAATLDPLFAEVQFRRGQALLALGQQTAALDAFLAAKELDVAPLRARENFLQTLRRVTGRRDLPLIPLPQILAEEGLERFGTAIPGREFLLDHVHPDIATHRRIAEEVVESMAREGLIDLGAGWTEQRRQAIFESVVEDIDPRYTAQRDLNLGKVLGWSGKLAEAEQPLRWAANVLEDEPDVYLNLGILLQKTGRWEEAVVELERASELDPKSATTHFNLGVSYARLDRLAEALEALETALRLQPTYGEAAHNLGAVYRRQGDLRKAESFFEKARDIDPAAASPYLGLGRLYRQQGLEQESEQAFRSAVERAEASAEARTELATTLAWRGNLDEADQQLRKVLTSQPGFAEAHYQLALVSSRRGRVGEAFAGYEEALRLDPNHLEARNNLAILLAGKGELQEASIHLLRSIEIEPGYADAYFNLGIVYENAGAPLEAVKAMTKALELAPDEPRFHLGLGLLFVGLGDLDRAHPHLMRARAAGLAIPPAAVAALDR